MKNKILLMIYLVLVLIFNAGSIYFILFTEINKIGVVLLTIVYNILLCRTFMYEIKTY